LGQSLPFANLGKPMSADQSQEALLALLDGLGSTGRGDVLVAWEEEGVRVCFEGRASADEPVTQQLLSVSSIHSDAAEAAVDILDQLLSIPLSQWRSRFGWTPPRR
jgi:hypothetical protein